MLRLALVKRGLDRTQHSFLRALSSSANSVSPQKKSLYNFKESENRWRDYWSNNVPFCPEPQNKKVFSMILPPANVTGFLHLGHALTISVQDTIVRYHRMRGENVSFVPGLDHAGIATQAVLEKKLLKEGKTRQSLGREAMEQELYKWSQEYSSVIRKQIKSMGAFLDWKNEYFTLDKDRSDFVQNSFIDLYNKKLIYRGTRMQYYCPYLQSVISDLEVDWLNVEKPMKYKLPDGNSVDLGYSYIIKYVTDDNRCLYVSTTRPETLFGDQAVAVHGDDPRYKSFVNHQVRSPITNKMIPVIQDNILVNSLEGCGAVKITPGHDMNDYECGLRHHLPVVTIMDLNGNMNEHCGVYKGLNRFECRKKLVEDLKQQNLLVDVIKHPMKIPICSRTGDLLEPTLLNQWFLKTSEMVKNLKENEIKIVPELYKTEWSRWTDDCKDWCISRQLYWGHRIPAYQVISEEKQNKSDLWCVGRTMEEATKNACEQYHLKEGTFTLKQDEDVLDTWFSSSLLPLSVTQSLQSQSPNPMSFYPLNVLETGNDILFFWVIRMAFMCKTLSNTAPFQNVVLHSTIRDASGRKMSKSRGNVIYPEYIIDGVTKEKMIETIEKSALSDKEKKMEIDLMKKTYPKGIPEMGVDVLRGGLLKMANQIGGLYISMDTFLTIRDFETKIYNAYKYITNPKIPYAYESICDSDLYQMVKKDGSLLDQWIWNEFNHTVDQVQSCMNEYKYSHALDTIRKFFYDSFCDKYLEYSKIFLSSSTSSSFLVYRLYTSIFMKTLQILHPYLPFITEELKYELEKPSDMNHYQSILDTRYPSSSHCFDSKVDQDSALLFNLITDIRSLSLIAHPLEIDTSTCNLYVHDHNSHSYQFYMDHKYIIEKLTHKKLNISMEDVPLTMFKKSYHDIDSTLAFSLNNLTPNAVIHKLNSFTTEYSNQIEKKLRKIVSLEEQCNNPLFQSRAPIEKQEEMRQQIKKLQSVVHDQQELLRTFEQIINNFNHDNDNILQ